MGNGGGILLTNEEIAKAPEDVQRWIRNSVLQANPAEDGFVLKQNGNTSSENGLAVCSAREIKILLNSLSENYAALQVFFQLGCDYRNPTTGERKPYALSLTDFRLHTDVGNIPRLRSIIHDINVSLQQVRGDPNAMLCRIGGHDVYHVHELTQYRIYRFWLPLSKAGTKHAHILPLPPAVKPAPDEHPDDDQAAI